MSGTISNANLDFRDATDTTCHAFAGEIDCSLTMRRNDVPARTNVSVEPRPGTTVTFDTVTTPGVAAVMPVTTADGTVPPNFPVYGACVGIPVYYEVSTTAASSGPITTCFDCPDANDDGVVDGAFPWVFEQHLRVLHEEGGRFVDRTCSLDTDANVLCAQTSGLSQLTVGSEAGQPIPWRDHSVGRARLAVRRAARGDEEVLFVTKDPTFLFPEPDSTTTPGASCPRAWESTSSARGRGSRTRPGDTSCSCPHTTRTSASPTARPRPSCRRSGSAGGFSRCRSMPPRWLWRRRRARPARA